MLTAMDLILLLTLRWFVIVLMLDAVYRVVVIVVNLLLAELILIAIINIAVIKRSGEVVIVRVRELFMRANIYVTHLDGLPMKKVQNTNLLI